MNRIDHLLKEKCPNGVMHVEIERLFNLRNGYTPSKRNPKYWESGTIPWFRMEDIRENGRVLDNSLQKVSESAVKGGNLFPPNSLLVATSATIGEHALVTVPHLSNQRFTSLVLNDNYIGKLDMKFAYYYGFILAEWCQNNTTISSFASVDMRKFRKFKFPIPPMDIQQEIVKILDTFSALEAELEAELEARIQQYEHYSRYLLEDSLESGRFSVAIVDELCAINRGRVISKDYLAKNPGPYPVYSSQTANEGIFGFIDTYDFDDEESITWTTDGAHAGSVFYHNNKKFNITNVCGRLVVKDDRITHRYLYFQLRQRAKRFVHAGMGNPKLMANHMGAIPIPVPSLDEQHRVVEILDSFDALINDLSMGLPAEITARRQQYEYYRDKLLTFKELETA